MKTIHIAVGDLNGTSAEMLLLNHKKLAQIGHLVYHVDPEVLEQAAKLLGLSVPEDANLQPINLRFSIEPGKLQAKSGSYSFLSLESALKASLKEDQPALVTLPIHKQAWKLAGLPYVGHTDYFRKAWHQEVIMLMGWDKFFVALFTDHIPLFQVKAKVKLEPLYLFFLRLYHFLPVSKIAVLGLNPHAGDDGLIGDEEKSIKQAISKANQHLQAEHRLTEPVFEGPFGADSHFAHKLDRPLPPYTVAIYHDQGLIPVKALLFDQAIQVSLTERFLRTSPDHGPGFDLAFQKKASSLSYQNAVRYAATAERFS